MGRDKRSMCLLVTAGEDELARVTRENCVPVGVRLLDRQHAKLFDMLNDLHAVLISGQPADVTGGVLRRLVRYTKNHFATEEVLMMATGYPGLARHRKLHGALTLQMENYAARYRKGEAAMIIHLLTLLRDWLVTHIRDEDSEYGPWMNRQGLF